MAFTVPEHRHGTGYRGFETVRTDVVWVVDRKSGLLWTDSFDLLSPTEVTDLVRVTSTSRRVSV